MNFAAVFCGNGGHTHRWSGVSVWLRLTAGAVRRGFAAAALSLLFSLLLYANANAQGDGDSRRVNVASDSAVYGAEGKQVTFSGNVVATFGEWNLNAATLQVSDADEGKEYLAVGSPLTIRGKSEEGDAVTMFANLIRFAENGDAVLEGGVRLCAGDECSRAQLNADKIHWQRGARNIQLTGTPASAKWQPPESAQGEGAVSARGNDIRYDFDSGAASLVGDALFGRDGAEITGKRIDFNVRTGEMKAEAPSEGRVRAVLEAGE